MTLGSIPASGPRSGTCSCGASTFGPPRVLAIGRAEESLRSPTNLHNSVWRGTGRCSLVPGLMDKTRPGSKYHCIIGTSLGAVVLISLKPWHLEYIASQFFNVSCYGHTTAKGPDPIRTRKSNAVGPD